MKDDNKVDDHIPVMIDMDDMNDLRKSYITLEHPSLAARLSSVIGTPIEVALQLLPTNWYRRIHAVSEKALAKTLKTAVSSMRRDQEVTPHEIYYKALVAGSGGLGGFFGLPGLVFELPVTTTLMLRGIAEIAREEGEDTRETETQLACVQVFALGGKTEVDDAAETGYYGVRLALSAYMTAA
ncbi:MAG: EcsC family protein, partial [Gammaproteobacteria bacterium]|nr:EcsC family protein [Gammaproteobacteria bacterium]